MGGLTPELTIRIEIDFPRFNSLCV